MADLKARSRDRWRQRGYHVENGETMMRAPGGIVRRHDIFGFTDLLCIPEPETAVRLSSPFWIWLQSTSWANVSSRLRKIQRETVGAGQWERPIHELARRVLERGDRILIEGWRKKKNGRYEVRERWVTLEDLVEG